MAEEENPPATGDDALVAGPPEEPGAETPEPPVVSPEPPRTRRLLRRFSFRGIFLTLVLLIVALMTTTVVYTSVSTDSCRTCHLGETTVWTKGAHKKVACYSCHGGKGPLSGMVNTGLRMRELAMSASGRAPEVIRSNVDWNRCLGCHREMIKQPLEANGIKVSHKEMIQARMDCRLCHSTVAHGNTVPVRQYPDMDLCMHCHDGKTARSRCAVCHVTATGGRRRNNTIWRVTHGKQWKVTHGMGDLSSCVACHRRQECRKCHGINMPHPQEWQTLHGKRAVASRQECRSCHLNSYCTSCHGTPMPHDKGYLALHSKKARNMKDEKCLRCHQLADCQTCHERHVHGGNASFKNGGAGK